MSGYKENTEVVTSPLESSKGQPLVRQISIEQIAKSPYQVRSFERDQNLDELSESIQSLGMLQPVLLRIRPDTIPRYELIAGERRLRAAESLGMKEVPALVIALEDQEALQASIVENLQRENLNGIEEALAYQRLVDDFSLTQREIAESVGKKRATISNSIRLLQLEPFVIEKIIESTLSAGHGRALLALETPVEQRRFARRAIAQSLSVHALERKISSYREQAQAENAYDESLVKKIERQTQKVRDGLGLDGVKLRLDSEGSRHLNLVFETEASWKRFIKKIR
ncbi:UNVERIFIED_CONTAM: hypothetical protein GTU68_055147 [Idotea baltica]|nr:hypothetical protein [Idotea baltica]